MLNMNQTRIGYCLIVLSLLLLTTLVLVKLDDDKKDVYLCELTHENNLKMEECPGHKSNTSWLIALSFGIAFLTLGSGLLLLFIPLRKEEQVKVDLAKLDEEERKIHDLLKTNEGSMYQSDLIKETDFSKVKITRILDKMEGRKLIDRKRRGMTNIIVLK